jgi:hypothetical protein
MRLRSCSSLRLSHAIVAEARLHQVDHVPSRFRRERDELRRSHGDPALGEDRDVALDHSAVGASRPGVREAGHALEHAAREVGQAEDGRHLAVADDLCAEGAGGGIGRIELLLEGGEDLVRHA